MIKFGLSIDTNCSPAEIIQCVKNAEEDGFRYAWIPDVGLCRDIFVLGGLIAVNTRSIMIGPGVTNPYTRNPATTALAVATLNEISGGRAVYGVGLGGYATLRPLGIATWDRPSTALEEIIRLSRSLFSGGLAEFKGRMFSVCAKSFLKTRVDIPIYVAAMSGM